ncbi:MAG: alanine racemase [Sphingobium sp.]
MTSLPAPLRLRLDGAALVNNWRWLAKASGQAACGAAVKADGYGLGAVDVMERLGAAGCRDFFVSNWIEATALLPHLPQGADLIVLHGVRPEDMRAALHSRARPVLCTPDQVARWREAGGGSCDLMVDTGMNRLGLDWRGPVEAWTQGLSIHTLHSHLASADEDGPLSAMQQARFADAVARIPARRASLANSAGIMLGRAYHFDLTRPGLALYGGVPRSEGAGAIRQVVFPQAQVVQRRRVVASDTVGYNAIFRAERDLDVAIVNIGYADGYLRAFSQRGTARHDGRCLPVLGRVSMDMIAVAIADAPDLREGDWIDIDYALPQAAQQSGLSQYELLTGLGTRFDRIWF